MKNKSNHTPEESKRVSNPHLAYLKLWDGILERHQGHHTLDLARPTVLQAQQGVLPLQHQVAVQHHQVAIPGAQPDGTSTHSQGGDVSISSVDNTPEQKQQTNLNSKQAKVQISGLTDNKCEHRY